MLPSEMDDIDRNIIIELQKDPRKQNTELAQVCRVSEATVRRHIDDLVSSGTLLLTAIPNAARLGYPIMAFHGFRVQISRVASVAERLCEFPELHYVSICAGRIDVLTWGDFSSNDHLSDFMSNKLGSIPGIIGTETLVQLRQVKRTHGRLEMRGSEIKQHGQANTVYKLDKVDFDLILELQRNSRRSNRELASILAISEATVRRRIKGLTESGTIELAAIPFPPKIGLSTFAVVAMQVELSRIDAIAERLARYAEVHYVGICSGPNQLLITILAVSPEELSEFITNELGDISGIITTETMFHLKYLKRTLGWLQSGAYPLRQSE